MLHKLISVTAGALLAFHAVAPAFAARELSRADYEACQARDETALLATITSISTDSLKAGTSRIDYAALVAGEWRKGGLDDIIDKRVDLAIEEVKNETSWSEILKSLGNSEVAQKLATSVAERVYRSDAVKTALETLITGVAREAGKTFEFSTEDATGPMLDCLKAYVGPRYGAAIASAVAGDAGKGLAVDPAKGGADVSTTDVVKQAGGGIAGATILVVRRQLANIAARVGQRIVGSVLSRLVGVVAGGVGLVLIAKDIWDFRNGVMPIIAGEMKSKDTKLKVQEELTSTLREQINEHAKEIAAASASHLLEIWRGFKQAHALVLDLSDRNGTFRAYLDGLQADKLPPLYEVVGLLMPAEGEAGVLKRLTDGTLNEAVLKLPAKGMQIARETGSLAKALAWTAVASDKLDSVAEFELHRIADPSSFTYSSLTRILALDDRTAIARTAALERDARDILFGLDAGDLKALAKNLDQGELTTLASYIKNLQPAPRERVLRAVAQTPAKMQVLASSQVRDAIISSADQSAAVSMMLESGTEFSPRAFARDLEQAWRGRISPRLMWDRYPAGILMLGFAGFLLVLWMRRLFRRPIKAASGTPTA